MKSVIQAVVLIVIAIILALAANAGASRDRKLVLPGYYPGARQIPPNQRGGQPPAPVQTQTTATAATPVTTNETTATAAPITTTTVADTESAKPATSKSATPKPAVVEPPKPKPVPVPAVAKHEFAPHPDKPYIEISGDEAAQLHSEGALTLDARRTSVYEQGHIAGARSFSVWESDIDDKVNKLYEERNDPREQLKPILVYCSGGDCEDSHMLAQKLWGVQFNNVYVYKDGFPDWQKRGGAIHRGSNP